MQFKLPVQSRDFAPEDSGFVEGLTLPEQSTNCGEDYFSSHDSFYGCQVEDPRSSQQYQQHLEVTTAVSKSVPQLTPTANSTSRLSKKRKPCDYEVIVTACLLALAAPREKSRKTNNSLRLPSEDTALSSNSTSDYEVG